MSRKRVTLLVVLGVVGIGLGLIAGGFNVSAAKGHLPGVSFILHTTMRNSVTLRAMSIKAPDDLNERAMIRRGAGHFDASCKQCHGAPGQEVNPVSAAMVPAPPHVAEAVRDWSAPELFWIVRNGIKMTGMPAWPASRRPDEVWAVVAFLQQVPDLSARDYADLVNQPVTDAATPDVSDSQAFAGTSGAKEIVQRCSACHGALGEQTEAGAFPLLNTLSQHYLNASLQAYRAGERRSGIMQPQVTNLTDAQTRLLARHFGQSAADVTVSAVHPDARNALWRRGKELARHGDPARKVPACAACHSPENYAPHPLYPVISGQPNSYLRQQLLLWRSGVRGGTPFAPLMHHAARQLTDEHIDALAAFYADQG